MNRYKVMVFSDDDADLANKISNSISPYYENIRYVVPLSSGRVLVITES